MTESKPIYTPFRIERFAEGDTEWFMKGVETTPDAPWRNRKVS